MTGPENNPSGTRPISVAELLAKNGTIGAPPVGGRRRRRRGNSDAVTVAELTGEIPVITDDMEFEPDEPSVPAPDPLVDTAVVAPILDEPPAPPEQRREEPRGRNGGPRPAATISVGTGAERMSPDPLYDLDEDEAEPADALVEADVHDLHEVDADDAAYDDYDDEYGDRPYGSIGTLFGGDSDVDDRRRPRGGADELDEDLSEGVRDADGFDDHDEHDGYDEETEPSSPLVRALWIVGQCVIAVAFGAGLFIAFDQLWKWNTIVALVLGVLVILGLAGGVRVVRKTEDIGSTLTAVAVGALVTFGPLALLQAS
ncbi:transmembrane protein [Mycolicibacterium conceptionense]|uniref:Transmembrane protein n=1 Tax=Mycolicibacterium conceptionense TaxID=451644 RepID=A0A0U1D6B8_9MYCO|nr:transmembrane protein [Mycolicibacterium conceptionense]